MSTHTYQLTIYKFTDDLGSHTELGSYHSLHTPWVPPLGQYFRFRDPNAPSSYGGRHPVNHEEVAGHVSQVVTMHYGTSTTIEVYLAVQHSGDLVDLLKKMHESSWMHGSASRVVSEEIFQKVLAACGVDQ